MSAHTHSEKTSYTLVLESRQMSQGLASLAIATQGRFDEFTGEQLYFLLSSLGDKLDSAFAAVKLDGTSVVTWGDADYGADSSTVKNLLATTKHETEVKH